MIFHMIQTEHFRYQTVVRLVDIFHFQCRKRMSRICFVLRRGICTLGGTMQPMRTEHNKMFQNQFLEWEMLIYANEIL